MHQLHQQAGPYTTLQKMMCNGFSVRTEYCSKISIAIQPDAMYILTFKDETLGGFVMFDTFQAILNAKLL